MKYIIYKYRKSPKYLKDAFLNFVLFLTVTKTGIYLKVSGIIFLILSPIIFVLHVAITLHPHHNLLMNMTMNLLN